MENITKELFNTITRYIKNIIANTEYENKVYAVGGCCRDIILNSNIKDIDLVVSLPDGGRAFAKWLYENGYLTGFVVEFPTYGTAKFNLKEFPDIDLEAVQTRNEEYINRDSRNPSTKFGTIEEDCFRRDLTINAIYYNISSEEFLDITKHSIEDINNHIIRTPDDPDITYFDDPLRILRCIRFASRFNWKIEEKTFEGMKRNIERLHIISRERIATEIEKIILCDNYAYGMKLLHEVNGMKYVLPTYMSHKDIFTYNKDIDTVNYLQNKTLVKAYYLLLENCDKAILYNLKFPVSFIRNIENLQHLIKRFSESIYDVWENYHNLTFANIREMQYYAKTEDMFNDMLDIINAQWYGKNINAINNIKAMSHKLVVSNKDFFGYKLPINGNDLMDLGISPGKEIRTILEKLTYKAFENPEMDKNDFIKLVSENMNRAE